MKHFILSAAALLALAACNRNPSTSEAADANAAAAAAANQAAAASVELPPAIRAEKTFRCKDNSLVYVNFFQGDRQVNLRTERTGTPITLRAEQAGGPYAAEGGYAISGDDAKIELTMPSKPEQTCHV